MTLRRWLIGCIVLMAVLIAGCEEHLPSEDLIATAVAAQYEVNRLADERAIALKEHEQIWESVRIGPQAQAAVSIRAADRFEKYDKAQAEQMREEAQAAFMLNPLVIQANLATSRYQEASDEYSKAVEALEEARDAIKRAGHWELYLQSVP